MDDPNWVDIATLGIAAVGVVLVLRGLRHSRAANFAAAWPAIHERLRRPHVIAGRYLLRSSNYTGTAVPDDDAVLKAWDRVRTTFEGASFCQTLRQELDPLGDSNVRARLLREIMADAVGEYDLVATLAIHSRIPGLLEVVEREFMDTIIPCWEYGRWVVKRRMEHSREEQYECFSVLYKRAHRRRLGLQRLRARREFGDAYPCMGGFAAFRARLRFPRWAGGRLWRAAWDGAHERDKLGALGGGGDEGESSVP